MAIVGGGPAGLMAAEVLSQAGVSVHLFDAMPSVGRKFLLAGKGGLNLTHSEPIEPFRSRYGSRQAEVAQWLDHMDAEAVRRWAQGLGVKTFVGSSGRVFPLEMKAAPLLRAWLQRLRHPASGVPVQFHMRHRWQGWDGDTLAFEPTGTSGVTRVRSREPVRVDSLLANTYPSYRSRSVSEVITALSRREMTPAVLTERSSNWLATSNPSISITMDCWISGLRNRSDHNPRTTKIAESVPICSKATSQSDCLPSPSI